VARIYDYLLGGKDNFAADRAAGEEALEAFPGLISSVRANRAFLARTVRYLAGERGIRQFLDIGTGIPASSNTHEVAQSVAPGSQLSTSIMVRRSWSTYATGYSASSSLADCPAEPKSRASKHSQTGPRACGAYWHTRAAWATMTG
jgi:hypothetical protein